MPSLLRTPRDGRNVVCKHDMFGMFVYGAKGESVECRLLSVFLQAWQGRLDIYKLLVSGTGVM